MPNFWELLETVNSPNGLNRLKIDCDTILVPEDMAVMAKLAEDIDCDPAISEWLTKRDQQSGGDLLSHPKAFKKTRLKTRIDLFSNNLEASKQKKLLVLLPTAAGMFMMPKSIFLQQFDPGQWDIIFVDSQQNRFEQTYDLSKLEPKEKRFYYEVGDLIPTVNRLASELTDLVNFQKYGKLVCGGASAGGGVGLLLADRLGADRGISVGAFIESDEDVDRLHPETPLYAIFSELFRKDKRAAKDLKRRLDVQPVQVEGAIKHNPFRKAIRGGALKLLIPDVFDPEHDPRFCQSEYSAWLKN